MTSSTVLKILDTLLMIGYVNKNSEKNYRLGAKLIRYANKNIEQNRFGRTDFTIFRTVAAKDR